MVQLYNSVLRWWLLCALESDCIAPTSELYCRFDGGRQQYGHCHRYDQSALNILLANYFSSASTDSLDQQSSSSSVQPPPYLVTSPAGQVLTVERGSRGKEQVVVCHAGEVLHHHTSSYL